MRVSLIQKARQVSQAWHNMIHGQYPEPVACFHEGYLAGYLAAMQELFLKKERPAKLASNEANVKTT